MIATPDFKAILWDMDGTLADSEALHLHTLIEVLKHHGIEAGEELHPLIFGKTGREVHALCCELFGLSTDLAAWSRFRARSYIDGARSLVPRPGALDVYRAAQRAGIAQAIVSNSSRMLLEANLTALDLQDLAAALAGGRSGCRGRQSDRRAGGYRGRHAGTRLAA
jgi:beta-phosphoglucomutase-like phosphatase (HAD superfamily)